MYSQKHKVSIPVIPGLLTPLVTLKGFKSPGRRHTCTCLVFLCCYLREKKNELKKCYFGNMRLSPPPYSSSFEDVSQNHMEFVFSPPLTVRGLACFTASADLNIKSAELSLGASNFFFHFPSPSTARSPVTAALTTISGWNKVMHK